MRQRPFLLFAAISLTALIASSVQGQDWLMRMKLKGKVLEAGPIAWSDHAVHVYARDGRLITFSPGDAKNFQKISTRFSGYTQSEMRGRLAAEFGKRFQVSGTGHYLVVHPVGQKDKWAYRFEELYRSFVHYFNARGWRSKAPKFPLVAVVFPTRKEFYRYTVKSGARVHPNVLGYYSPTSNRICLYDVTKDKGDEDNWHINAETIIHEATHQTAFNLGIHNRTADTPRWVAEGLGTMFEAQGVWNSRAHPSRSDRINRERLEAFRAYAGKKRRRGSLASFISTEDLFRRDADAAYAEAWALTFFLVETRSRAYLRYLSMTASIPVFEPYKAQHRLRDFTKAFGSNLAVLESHFLRFMKTVK